MLKPIYPGVHILPGEEKKLQDAIQALKEDHHAPRHIDLRFVLETPQPEAAEAAE